jgi:chorismate mutase
MVGRVTDAMAVHAIRGATQVPANDRDLILESTVEQIKHVYGHGAAALRPDIER